MSPAREQARAIKRASSVLLVQRRRIAQDVIALGKQISRAPLAEGQIGNVLKLHGLWHQLGEVEEMLQILAGTPPEEAGVWPSRYPSDAASQPREDA